MFTIAFTVRSLIPLSHGWNHVDDPSCESKGISAVQELVGGGFTTLLLPAAVTILQKL